MNQEKPVWHKGAPPHVGWWNASVISNFKKAWRWWDGKHWSCALNDTDPPALAGAIATISAVESQVRWTNYYPADARVPRVAP